jgi:glycosyltransferase involved in cell wall biosynthesis
LGVSSGLLAAVAAPPAPPPARHVLQIGSGWFPERKGGAETVFHALYQHLPAQGFAVRGLVPGSAGIAGETGGRMRGVAVEGVPLPRRALALRAATRALLQGAAPDLLAAHFALYTLPVLDLLRRVPMVLHFHGPWAEESRLEGGHALAVAAKRLAERLVYARAGRAIVLSAAFGTILTERYGVPADRLRLVPGGVDCDRFGLAPGRPEARAMLGWPADRPILLAVRRLVRRMGLDRLIDAVALLRRRHPDLLLLIAGTGPERAALEARVAAAGLADAVRFLGFVPDAVLPLAYRAADLGVVPSQALEGFGLIAVESLASGTPVAVTRVGGLPEIVAPLSPGLVLPGLAAAEIAEGLGALLGGALPLPDAAACRHFARQRFDWPVIAAQTAAVYREVT